MPLPFTPRNLLAQPLRLPRLRPYAPGPGDPRIFAFNTEREEVVRRVVKRVLQRYEANAAIERILSDAAYEEIRRLEKQKDTESRESLGSWRRLHRRLGQLSRSQKTAKLENLSHEAAQDIAGNFDPRVYELSRRLVPRLLTGVMHPARLVAEVRSSRSALDDLVEVQGDIHALRRLQRCGTLIYAPTHSSNLDSIVLGYALERSGLSPVVYGAGKNLFTNPMISFFMHNLGAYRVDRRIRSQLYKEVLKTYACVMIERGYHSLFFPGGTRSRSGMIEKKLKLGLLGAGVEAFARNQTAGDLPSGNRRVFVIPTTINYALVLEAETLIGDWLSESGKSRYIIEDDEFSRFERWIAFVRKLLSTRMGCVVRFGRPCDPFGNPVDLDGQSVAPSGQTVDPASYVWRGGQPTVDAKRDQAYTRQLGEFLALRLAQESVILPTHLVAHVLFRDLMRSTAGMDLFGRIRLRDEIRVPRAAFVSDVGTTRDRLLALEREGAVHVHDSLRQAPEEIVQQALRAWDGYHQRLAAHVEGSSVVAADPRLLLYYQNRLVPFAERLEDLDGKSGPAAREIQALGNAG